MRSYDLIIRARSLEPNHEEPGMTIEAHHLQTWNGTDVLDSSAQKLGEIDDVSSCGDEPVAISIAAAWPAESTTLRGCAAQPSAATACSSTSPPTR